MRIERKRLTDQIIEQLTAMIADGKFKPGDKLPPERVLMEQFGVGRSSLREAIGALSLVGVLSVRPGHGTHVSPAAGDSLSKPFRWSMSVSWRDKLHEFIEARITLEKALVAMAAQRATAEELEEIRRCHGLLKSAKVKGRKAIQADLVFHTAVAKASHNSVLAGFLAELRQPVRQWMEQKASLFDGYAKVYDQHDAVVRALEARDPEAARRAMEEHLEAVGERLARALLERGAK